jgi:HD superfamily phosphohydrolase
MIYDPIHGYLKVQGNCLAIIDSPIFKRLQHIKQLGAAYYVFPGASHNRFEHSLGVAHLAERMLKSIRNNQPELNITERQIELVKIAGLCHDLGHGPFSHAFDNEILPRLLGEEERVVPHEERSGELLEEIVKSKGLDISPEEIRFIKTCIHPDPQDLQKSEHPYLFEIVANPYNGIDVDKFDYLKRDPYNIGLDYHFNSERLVEEARIINGHVCFPEKLGNSILQLFSVRYNFLREICNHPVVKSIEYMLTDAIVGAEKLLQLTQTHNTPHFADITDEITYLIKLSKDPEIKVSQELLQKIEARDLYHYAGEVKIPDHQKILKDGLPDEILKKYNICESDVLMHHMKLSYSNSQSYPLSMVSFYKYDKPDECFALYRKDMPRLLPSSICEKNTVRFFSRNNHDKVKLMVTEIKLKYRN